MENVFDRRTVEQGQAIISERFYNFIIGLTLCWGFGINYLMVKHVSPGFALQYGFWPFIIAYFIMCFLGIYLFTKYDEPLISFLGYNLVVVPFGFVINIVVSQYSPSLVLQAVQMTGIVTLIMMFLGTLFPAFFKKIVGALTIALFAMIIVELVAVYFFKTHHTIIDWIVAAIFCGYIGYDWGRAQQIPKTVDNAVDSAAALYMDIINLFLRILRIMGRRR
ncbi:MAG TPA: Bax inhibitor-1 family protein [Spirochaetota bacterium]|nr:Bax inhibitor-1 family protein [Spirochaetota bacterium]